MAELPLAPIRRIIKSTGADRISDEAAVKLAAHLEMQGEIVAENAYNLAKHAGRKTVNGADIDLAVKTLYD